MWHFCQCLLEDARACLYDICVGSDGMCCMTLLLGAMHGLVWHLCEQCCKSLYDIYVSSVGRACVAFMPHEKGGVV